MNYLLDTHTFIWSLLKSELLSETAREIIENTENTIFVSTFTFWEIAVKTAIKKFDFNGIDVRHFPNLAKTCGFALLQPDDYDCITSFELPMKENHKDPFDRMLIHLATRKNLILLSKDSLFEQYKEDGLQLVW